MCKVPAKLRELVKQRLAAAAEEIFELLERTITEYEEELKYRRQGALFSSESPPSVRSVSAGASERGPSAGASECGPSAGASERGPSAGASERGPSAGASDRGPSLLQELEPPHIKEEQDEDMLHCDIITSHLCSIKREDHLSGFQEVSGVSVKSEEEEALETHTEDEWTPAVHHNSDRDPRPDPRPDPSLRPDPDQTPASVPRSRDTLCPDSERKNRRIRNLIKCHVCPSCGKAFPANSMLERHMRVHTGERPFSCSVCGKSFSQKGNLQSHMIVHTGESPFCCSLCGKSVKTSRNLRLHMSRHQRKLTLVT